MQARPAGGLNPVEVYRMLAVEISRHGGPDVLVPVDRADPVPGRGEVLVRNRWVGVNYVDLQHREGRPYPVTLPLVPGTEAAGAIVAAGPGVDAGLVGTPVVHFGHLAGVYAELTAVPLDYVVPLPPDTPLDVAAAVALSGTTAHVLTSAAHRVGPGDVVVVHAAAGATGGAVVQRAASAGADVIAIASTAEKAAAATTLGAGHAIALRETPDPVAAVVAASHYLSGPHERARALTAVLDEVRSGKFNSRIAGRFPLRQAAQAHALLARRTVQGKLLLQA